MTTTEAWTIRRLLDWTSDYLKQHGSDSPRLDAEILLAQVRNCDRIFLYTSYQEVASEEQRSQFKDLVMQRARGTPVAYLVGHKEFFSTDFEVTPDVLIPRPETEFIITELIDVAKGKKQRDDAISIADIGTGSGVLAICSALHLANASITAIDISDAALAVAKRNAVKHAVDDRIKFVQSDLFANIVPQSQFDFVLCNPPYIAETERDSIPTDVRDYEPDVALFGGADGLCVIRRLLLDAPKYIKPTGLLLFEICPKQADDCIRLLDQHPALELVGFVKDLDGQSRIVSVRRV